jgi:hypothetical protein
VSGRGYTNRLVCAEGGCGETSSFHSDTRADQRESLQWYAKHPYRCYRHTNPEQVLSVENPQTVGVLIATRVEQSRLSRSIYDTSTEPRYLQGLYWHTEDGKGGSGLTSGPGFKAIASDLPEGTRLVVTARLEFPEVTP